MLMNLRVPKKFVRELFEWLSNWRLLKKELVPWLVAYKIKLDDRHGGMKHVWVTRNKYCTIKCTGLIWALSRKCIFVYVVFIVKVLTNVL
jgi:hypothetical protein